MYSFGVIQVPTTTKRAAAAPGYAYVPDLGRQQPSASVSANVPQQTKRRAARALNNTATGSEYSAKQDAKIARELAALDREPGAGAGIVVAKRSGDTAAGRGEFRSRPWGIQCRSSYISTAEQNDAGDSQDLAEPKDVRKSPCGLRSAASTEFIVACGSTITRRKSSWRIVWWSHTSVIGDWNIRGKEEVGAFDERYDTIRRGKAITRTT